MRMNDRHIVRPWLIWREAIPLARQDLQDACAAALVVGGDMRVRGPGSCRDKPRGQPWQGSSGGNPSCGDVRYCRSARDGPTGSSPPTCTATCRRQEGFVRVRGFPAGWLSFAPGRASSPSPPWQQRVWWCAQEVCLRPRAPDRNPRNAGFAPARPSASAAGSRKCLRTGREAGLRTCRGWSPPPRCVSTSFRYRARSAIVPEANAEGGRSGTNAMELRASTSAVRESLLLLSASGSRAHRLWQTSMNDS
jgi:hypothetical protein